MRTKCELAEQVNWINIVKLFLNSAAKKLPKNEGTGQQQNIRPGTGSETNQQRGNCCNKWCSGTEGNIFF